MRRFCESTSVGKKSRAIRFLVNLGLTGPTLSFGILYFCIISSKYVNKILNFNNPNSKFKMTKTKKTLGMNWTRYHNLYGVTYKLHEGMRSLGWSAEVIQKYTIDHAHEVNEESAAKHQHNPPDLPRNDDAKWLSQHPKL